MNTPLATDLAALPDRIVDIAPSVTVVGDVLLDSWLHGTSDRLAREAPVPVFDQHRESVAPGGAANTAVNLAAMGARVHMVGLVGEDPAGERLRSLLVGYGVDTSYLVSHPEATTTVKTRVVVDGQVTYRIDQSGAPAAEAALQLLARTTVEALDTDSTLVICDYGGAVAAAGLPSRLAETLTTSRPPLTVVDAHEPERWSCLAPDLVTPNAAETEHLLGVGLGHGAGRIDTVMSRCAELAHHTGARQVVVTLDKDGTVVLDEEGPVYRTWASPVAEKQASGAGDTFVAALVLARAAGAGMSAATDLAQTAADVVVHRLGTSLCTTADLRARLTGHHDPLTSMATLKEEVEYHRSQGRRIVLTNGCFDVLHRGHTTHLTKAAALGDVLVVAVNDDDSVRRLKGSGRPVNHLQDRAGVLAELGCVDYVTSFDGDTAVSVIEALRPDIYVKGGDHTAQTLPETRVVEQYGGSVRILEYLTGHSTTALLGRVRIGAGAHAADPLDGLQDGDDSGAA